MHSMDALAATATSSPPAIGGWGLAAAAVVILVLARRKTANGGSTSTTTGRIRGFWNGLKNTFAAIVRVYRFLEAVVRFFGGREMRGGARSTATFLRAGAPTVVRSAPQVSMASVAAPAPKVSLVKKPRRQPSPWARNAAAWLRSYSGHGSGALDWTVRAVLWGVRAVTWVWRVLRAVYQALRTAYNVVAPPVVTFFRAIATVVRVLRGWHCWPYAARGLVRLIGVAFLVGWLVPAWRGWTTLAVFAASAPLGLLIPHLTPQEPSADALYGPKLWVILRDDLGLPEDAEREDWLLLPERVADADARVVIRLPETYRGSLIEREAMVELVNTRLPGEWVARWKFTADTNAVVFTRKPPAKPKEPDPECPDMVDFYDPRVQEILTGLKPAEFFLGFDENNAPVIRKMSGETSHWAYSVGSGGGKSTTLQFLAVQMVMKRGTIVGIDPKLISLAPLEGVEGVHLYKDPENGLDMRRAIQWVADVVMARFYEIEQGTATEFDPLYLFLEECNELAALLKAVWNRVRVKTGEDKDPAGDPIWEEAVGRILRFGRAANVHAIAVFQDFKDNEFGGMSLQPLFRFKALGNYDVRQWERITGMSKAVMPPNVDKAGRMVTVTEGKPVSYQTPYLFIDEDPEEVEEGQEPGKRGASEDEAKDLYNQLYRELRAVHGHTTHGLYSTPPANSPRGLPKLLRGRGEGLSRDTGAEGRIGGLEGGLSDETAGGGVTHPGSVTGDVTGVVTPLRLIPGQGGAGPAEDPTAAPELLSLAEIARRLEDDPNVPKDATLRQHKARRDDFPAATVINGKELYLESQISAYYTPQEKQA